MSWYRSGTVTVANGSPTVTGAGTDFVSNVSLGEAFRGPDGRTYEIAAVVSATELTLAEPYMGGSGGGQTYAIQPTASFARDLALGAASLLNTFGAVRDGIGQGFIRDGTVAAPGIRFEQDQDTGFRRVGANILALVTGGADRLTIDASGRTTISTSDSDGGASRALKLYADVAGTAEPRVDFGTAAQSFSGGIGVKTLTGAESEMTFTANATIGGTARFRLYANAAASTTCRFQMGAAANANAAAIAAVPVSGTAGVLMMETSGAERMRIDASGRLLVGVATGDRHRIAGGSADGAPILDVVQSGTFFAGSNTGFSLSNAGLWLVASGSTGRSLNAAGTLNASGADYAEYMTKATGCGTIAKGDVCGVDRDGRLTKTWADAISFVVKSTDPGIVLGDAWGQSVGPRPEGPGEEPIAPSLPQSAPASDSEADVAAWQAVVAAYPAQQAAHQAAHAAWTTAKTAYDTALPEWEGALEAERQKVDRIAFSGQVPVNVTGDFAVGDYLIAAASGAGIKAVALPASEITFDQYRRRLGKVWAVRDGRAWVDVQHG